MYAIQKYKKILYDTTKPRIFVPEKVMKKVCLIELGSNEPSEATVRSVQDVLRTCFPSVRFGRLRQTEPVGIASPRPFFNISGRFETHLTQEEVTALFKRIEADHGRRPEDKAQNIVRIDIDLLVYGDTVLKAKDLQREYVRAGLADLGIFLS